MARGSESKEKIINTLTEIYSDAFIGSDGKTLRIPLVENGEPIEIKVSLTAAKDLEGGGASKADTSVSAFATETNMKALEPTQEELNKVSTLMSQLGF